ncbi:MAG: thioredoxin domain-containing protein [Patescibacteria group bacterium]|nr:thioredoxin domain-containing protein [Patescibacteria group bacterium]MDE2589504.1 thioredoxin domain-containing protein [Patescibacteria group bacterium]
MADEEHLTKAQLKEQRKQERHAFEQQMNKAQKSASMRKFGLWLGGALVVLLSIWGLFALVTAPGPSQNNLLQSIPALTADDISFGPTTSKATLVEYADFQCPACRAYYPLVKQLNQDFKGKLHYVYRFFPLTAIHKNAMVSAEAGYAAAKQGKFLEMADLLFTNQPSWEGSNDAESVFVGYAKQLNLNTDQFTADMHAKATADFIQKQEDAGTNAGVDATPTFFLNGKQIQNPSSYVDFRQLIVNALAGK